MSGSSRYGEAEMRRVLHELARRLDMASSGARLLHLANNAVYLLPLPAVVVRITRSRQLHDRVHKVARLGRWFSTVDAPAIRLAPGVPQPVSAGELLATVWEYTPPHQPMPTVDDLGSLLRSWHALPAPGELPQWNPVEAARRRITDADGLDDGDRDWLLGRCDELEPRVAALTADHPECLVHGDAHLGNLIRRHDGRVVFCDFDSTCIGPPQADLTAVAAAEIWFDDRGGTHSALVRAYGHDVTTVPGWPTYRSAQELAFVVSGVPLLHSAPGINGEFRKRLDSIRRRDETVRWIPYARFGIRSDKRLQTP
ncbi:phosphotransferase family enzyme [Stackebrandtia endophytica]|uniref:Phosphotransferase family enzyme n=2 Tax=Stackebrandtia endophytica TaxID=1496996 RepID=A0A543ATR1_9ACTN|nr:aminoglycoside phosphotransferase family protein [Stackebrandtia endophytica]TQL75949.1 phosphotransferase family enzyme [Stackebrandtia endophytica]